MFCPLCVCVCVCVRACVCVCVCVRACACMGRKTGADCFTPANHAGGPDGDKAVVAATAKVSTQSRVVSSPGRLWLPTLVGGIRLPRLAARARARSSGTTPPQRDRDRSEFLLSRRI